MTYDSNYIPLCPSYNLNKILGFGPKYIIKNV